MNDCVVAPPANVPHWHFSTCGMVEVVAVRPGESNGLFIAGHAMTLLLHPVVEGVGDHCPVPALQLNVIVVKLPGKVPLKHVRICETPPIVDNCNPRVFATANAGQAKNFQIAIKKLN